MREPTYKVEKFENLKEMLNNSAEKYGERPAYVFKPKKDGKFQEITYKQFKSDVDNLGTALINLGLKDKRVAIISDNRYEWEVSYFAVTNGTGVAVPLDKALPDNELESSIIRSEAEAIIYSDKYDKVMEELKDKKNSNLKIFISMDLKESKNGIISFNKLIERGREAVKDGDRKFIDATIDAEKMGIMLFTSGTTSKSKAVMLSQKNLMTNIFDISSTFNITKEDRFLSFLPLHHTFECTVGFLFPISRGSSIAFCEGLRHFADNIKEYDVTALIAVPELFEAIGKRLIKEIDKKGKTKQVKFGMKISNVLLKLGVDVRDKIFKEVREAFAPKLRIVVTGGAALDPETEKLFNNIGIALKQGYGLTETSPVIASEDDKYQRIGSIGKAMPSIDVKLTDVNEEGIGELMAKGDSIMLGYYQNEEATNEVLEKDGWFHTGDLARIDKDGFIFITGRKKFVIVLKNGKNIYPEELETLINKVTGVKESMVYGDPQDNGDYKVSAKIVYDKEIMKEAYGLTDEKKIKDRLWQEIKNINKTMPQYKYIKEIIVTDEELIKTTTLKTKRFEEMKKLVNK